MASGSKAAGRDALGERHADLRRRLEALAADAHERDAAFRERVDAWAERSGLGDLDPEGRIAAVADRYALLLVGAALDPAAVGGGGADGAVEWADGADPVFEAFPVDEGMRRDVADLAGSGIDSAGLPALYEAVADDDRRDVGRFYTPRWLADALVRWALPDPDGDAPRVLDPAAGAGSVLAAAHDRLARRGVDGDAIARNLHAVDVDGVALRLAALAVGGQGDGRVTPRTHRASFFDVEPEGSTGKGSGDESGDAIGPVDAVVGNPPYLRASEIDVEGLRRHLDAFDGGYRDGEAALSRRSDAYVYFLTHATRFLRPGGRLAFVLPTKWLQSGYGEGLQRFLFDHYRVRGVVGFEGRAFEDALVDTCLLFAERDPDADARAGNAVRFARLPPGDPGAAARATRGEVGDGVGGDAPSRVVSRPQSGLDPGKLARYLDAPDDLLSFLESGAVVPLSALASVSRGVTTGANRFFFLDAEAVERRGIEGRFLAPAMKSIRGVETRVLESEDVDGYLLDVHGYVEEVTADAGEGASAERVEEALARDGHDGLLDYVRHGESEGWDAGRTCRARRVWFDLGPLPAPDLFFPKLLRERLFVVENRADAAAGNAVDCLAAREGVDPTTLAGVLESTLAEATMEVWGRDEAGMLQLMTYETGSLPVPDVREFAPEERAAIREATERLRAGRDGAREELDDAVLSAVDADLSVGRVRDLRERLLSRRLGG